MIVKAEDWDALQGEVRRLASEVQRLRSQQEAVTSALLSSGVVRRYPPNLFTGGWYVATFAAKFYKDMMDALLDWFKLEWHEEPAHSGLRVKE